MSYVGATYYSDILSTYYTWYCTGNLVPTLSQATSANFLGRFSLMRGKSSRNRGSDGCTSEKKKIEGES